MSLKGDHVKRIVILAIAAFLPATQIWAADSCQLYSAAQVDMGTDSNGGVYVPMTIKGHEVNMLVDTGGILSMLTDSTVDALGLTRQSIPISEVEGFGGKRVNYTATGYDIVFGKLKTPSFRFFVAPPGIIGDLNGTIAPDILSAYDVEFDFANGKFNLLLRNRCPDQVVYWTQDTYAEIPFELGRQGHIKLPVQIDGKDVVAIIDTGSSRSIMSLDTAEDLFKFDAKSADLKLVADSTEKQHTYRYPFHTITFKGIAVQNPDILLVPDEESHIMRFDESKIIIGMDVLRQLHLYIAYHDRKLYATAASAH